MACRNHSLLCWMFYIIWYCVWRRLQFNNIKLTKIYIELKARNVCETLHATTFAAGPSTLGPLEDREFFRMFSVRNSAIIPFPNRANEWDVMWYIFHSVRKHYTVLISGEDGILRRTRPYLVE